MSDGKINPAEPFTPGGRCGDRSPLLMPTSPRPCCELPAGHAGWHKDGGAEWTPDPPTERAELEAPPAGLSADQAVRAWAAVCWSLSGRGWKLGDWCVWIRDGEVPSDSAEAKPQP